MDTTRYDDAIAQAIAVYPSVPFSWVKAVIGKESSFADVRDTWEKKVNEYAYGPMQILLSTARGLGFDVTAAELRTPAMNILVGTAYLRQLIDDVGADFRRVYSAYNSGNPDRWLTSEQVRANVDGAVHWLEQFDTPSAIGAGVIVLLVLGVLWAAHH